MGRVGAAEAEAARPDTEVHQGVVPHGLNHGGLSPVPVHHQEDKVTHGEAEVHPVKEPDKVRGHRQRDAEHGEDGDHQVHRVHPKCRHLSKGQKMFIS